MAEISPDSESEKTKFRFLPRLLSSVGIYQKCLELLDLASSQQEMDTAPIHIFLTLCTQKKGGGLQAKNHASSESAVMSVKQKIPFEIIARKYFQNSKLFFALYSTKDTLVNDK